MNKLKALRNADRDLIRQLITIYSLAGLLSLTPILIHDFAGDSISLSNLFLLSIAAVAVSTWYGGIKAGLFASSISILTNGYFLIAPYSSMSAIPTYLIDGFILYSAVNILICVLVDQSWHSDRINSLRRVEQQNTKLLHQTQQELLLAQAQIKARDEFLSIASHELKTPLTSMILQLQTILNNIRNVSLANFSVENLLKMLESAESQSKRVSKMINDLLNVSLITTGRLDLDLEETDLTAVTQQVVNNFQEKAKKEGYQLNFTASKPVVGQWDKVRLEQVITNLVSNALKYGDKKPINVSVHNSNGTGKVTVTDQGIGIPSKYQDRIFARFERAVTSQEYQGLGVGLYITHQIVKAHHGSIKLSSQEHRGSTFTVELPLTPAKT